MLVVVVFLSSCAFIFFFYLIFIPPLYGSVYTAAAGSLEYDIVARFIAAIVSGRHAHTHARMNVRALSSGKLRMRRGARGRKLWQLRARLFFSFSILSPHSVVVVPPLHTGAGEKLFSILFSGVRFLYIFVCERKRNNNIILWCIIFGGKKKNVKVTYSRVFASER